MQRVHPWNKRIHPPTAVIAAPVQGNVFVKAGSGVTVVQGPEEFADLPVDVEPLSFDAIRDGDARFRSVFELDDREDVGDNGWMLAGASLPVITGVRMAAEDVEVFGDRHCLAGDRL